MWILLPLITAATTVYFVPHSHIDVGWIDVTSYYYTEHGSKIMNTMLTLLEEKPDRKFCWSEAFFFANWLKDHPDYIPRLRRLVENGQLEIAGGGWVMNDEALTDFENVARQVEAGHKFLREQLGVGPIKVAWQLDPFGHSSVTPAIFERLGFEYMVMSRVDGNYRTQMRNSGDMEFLWKSNALGAEHGLFTHLLYHHYSLPEILDERQSSRCFYSLSNFQKDLNTCLDSLETYVNSIKKGYKSSNILILYGDDISFKYLDSSRKQFELIEALQAHSKNLQIKITTPSEYFKAVLQENHKYKVFEGDLLPYVSEHIRQRPLSWTGFFSSRPALKKRVYEVQSLVRTTEILNGILNFQDFEAREVSVLLHHDAITGTCQPDTAEDYFKRLDHDERLCMSAINDVYEKHVGAQNGFQVALNYKVFIIFNSLNWQVKKIVKVKIAQDYGRVFNSLQEINSQSVEINGKKWLFWEIETQGLSFVTVFVVESNTRCPTCHHSVNNQTEEVDNGAMTVTFSKGLIESVSFPGHLLFLASSYIKYNVQEGGAYEFRPRSPPSPVGNLESFKVQSGPLFSYVESTFAYSSKKIIQKVTIPHNSLKFYLNIYTGSEIGDEIFLKVFNSNSKKDWLYTFNSADIIKRYQFEKRSNCYGENGFPVVSGMFIDYKSTFMQVYPKFPFGVHLAENDYFLIHLHRNPPYDDVLGLGSPLLDKVPVEHEFLVNFANKEIGKIWKEHLNFKHSPLVLTYDSSDRLVKDLDSAKGFDGLWNKRVKFSLANQDECLYLSRVFFNRKDLVASVMNVCEKDLEFSFGEWKEVKEVQADGYEWSGVRNEVKVEGELKFMINKNTPETLWKYYGTRTKNISPFHLNTYKVSTNGTTTTTTATQPLADQQSEFSTFIGLQKTISSPSSNLNSKDTDILFLSVISLFGISVTIVLTYTIYKMRTTKKLD